MAKRALRVVKNLGRIPAVAVCTVCGKTFEAPLGALVSFKDAEANLQQQFYVHKCGPALTWSAHETPIKSLGLQGGPLIDEEAEEFVRSPYFQRAILIRRWDDLAKVPGMVVPDLQHFRSLLESTDRREVA